MMLDALKTLMPSHAAGVLSRIAMSIDDETNPAATERFANESEIRKAVIDEIRRKYNIGEDQDDKSHHALSDAIDKEIELIEPSADGEAVLESMSAHGTIPSDLYNINIIENVEDLYKKHFIQEKLLIENTIRTFDQVQHFTDPEDKDYVIVSLFLKNYPNRNPFRSFKQLVAGSRDGLTLDVHQSWRIYEDEVDLSGIKNLADVLKKFVSVFGLDFLFNGEKTKFKLAYANRWSVEIVPPVKINSKGKRTIGNVPRFTFTSFSSTQQRFGKQASLIVAINLDKYMPYLKRHGWPR